MTTSRSMVVTQTGSHGDAGIQLPSTGDDDGLLKVELVGVCGSDPGIFRGKVSRGLRLIP